MPRLRSLALALVSLSLACTSRKCSGARPLNATIAERRGPGYHAKITCVVSTRVVIDRSTAPLLRGCRATTSFELRAFDSTRAALLEEASNNFDDCRDAERSCRAVRAELFERQTPSGTIVGARSNPGRTHKYFIVARPESIAYGPEHAQRSIDQLPEPAALAMQFARSGALSDRERNANEGFLSLFTPAFVESNADELQSLALRCELRAPFVEAVARARPAVFDPLFRGHYFDGVEPSCAGRMGGLQSADPARFRRAVVDALASPSLTAVPQRRTELLTFVASERIVEAAPSVRREARASSERYSGDPFEARRWATALCTLVAIDREHAHEQLLPLFAEQPATDRRVEVAEPCVLGQPSMRWNFAVESLASALDSLRTPAVFAGLARIVDDRRTPESTRTLARTLLDRAAPRDR